LHKDLLIQLSEGAWEEIWYGLL